MSKVAPYKVPSLPLPLGNQVALSKELVESIFFASTGLPSMDVDHYEAIRAESPNPICLIQGVKDGKWVGQSFYLSAHEEDKVIRLDTNMFRDAAGAIDEKAAIQCACNLSGKGRGVELLREGKPMVYMGLATQTLADKHEDIAELAKMDREIADWAASPEGKAAAEEQERETYLDPETLAAGIEILANGTLTRPPAEYEPVNGNWWVKANCQADIDAIEKAMGKPIEIRRFNEGHGASEWTIYPRRGPLERSS